MFFPILFAPWQETFADAGDSDGGERIGANLPNTTQNVIIYLCDSYEFIFIHIHLYICTYIYIYIFIIYVYIYLLMGQDQVPEHNSCLFSILTCL